MQQDDNAVIALERSQMEVNILQAVNQELEATNASLNKSAESYEEIGSAVQKKTNTFA